MLTVTHRTALKTKSKSYQRMFRMETTSAIFKMVVLTMFDEDRSDSQSLLVMYISVSRKTAPMLQTTGIF